MFRRWKCSRGFGVHSPFAYSFIVDVLRERRYGYYAYDLLPDDEAVRLWFRIVCRFQPRAVAVEDPAHGDEMREAARMASPGCSFRRDASFRYIADCTALELAPGDVVVARRISRDVLQRAFGSLDCGMCFTNVDGGAVVAALPHLPHQQFDLLY